MLFCTLSTTSIFPACQFGQRYFFFRDTGCASFSVAALTRSTVNERRYLVLDKLPPEYDSRVQGMEVDEKPVDQSPTTVF